MAYSIVWNESSPVGASVSAADIDAEIQNFKISIRERMNNILLNTWETDANDPKTLDPAALSLDKVVLSRSATLSIANDTLTGITWNNEITNADSLFDSGSPTIITIQATGTYLIILQANFVFNATGYRRVEVAIANTTIFPFASHDPPQVTGSTGLTCSCVLAMTAADTIIFKAYQNSTGVLNLSANSTYAMVAQLI